MARFASQKRHTTSIMHRFKFRLTCRAKDALFMHRAIMSSMDQVLLLCPRPLISLYVSIWASPLDLWYPRPRFRAWVGGSREAGSYQGDAIRTIEAWWDSPAYTSVGGGCAYNGNYSSGCYQTVDGAAYHTFGFDVSKTVPTAVENRPINVTLPVILYLGLPA